MPLSVTATLGFYWDITFTKQPGAVNQLTCQRFSDSGVPLLRGTTGAAVTGTIAGTTLTVSTVTSGSIMVDMIIVGNGVTAGTKIVALGGAGTYTVSATHAIGTAQAFTMFFVGSCSVSNRQQSSLLSGDFTVGTNYPTSSLQLFSRLRCLAPMH